MSQLRVGGGALIVAGTSIGAGMLGLPVVSGACGFIPALFILLACWAFMCATGILYAELACVYKDEANISTMAVRTLGPIGKPLTLVVYLFLFYTLTVVYFVGGGNILATWIPQCSDAKVRIILFALIFIPVVAIGKRVVDPLNKFLMGGLLVAYCGFVVIGTSSIVPQQLFVKQWLAAPFVLPVAFTSFAYQGTIPTLANWMCYDVKNIRKAIIIGTACTLLIYTIWVMLILGIIPYSGEWGLQYALVNGQDSIQPLEHFTGNRMVFLVGRLFAFCAITTSFLGVGIGLVDFIRDLIGKGSRFAPNQAILLVLSFALPLFVALSYPHIFLEALGYAGGFGSALLLGALPIAMVYIAKYRHQAAIATNFYTKKSVLFFLFVFVILEIGCECIHLLKGHL